MFRYGVRSIARNGGRRVPLGPGGRWPAHKSVLGLMALIWFGGALYKWPPVDITVGIIVGVWIIVCVAKGRARSRPARMAVRQQRAEERQLEKMMAAASVR
jgi:hypothetical protein